MEMDQEVAKKLLMEGATLILLGVPAGTEFGIDLKSWHTKERFMGVKMIPPGIHTIYYSATDRHGDIAPRISFFHDFKPSEFLVKKWDWKQEELSSADVSEEEVSRLKGDILNLDQNLGPYPFEIWKKWKKLTDKLTDELVHNLTPESGVIRSALELTPVKVREEVPKEKRRSSRSREEKEEDLLPELRAAPGSEPRFTPIPKHAFPEGSSPADITRHSMDPSYMLDTMLNSLRRPTDLLAEIQFSFLCFLVGLSFEALEHWKQVVNLVCRCETAILRRREIYLQLLPMLETQLSHIPEDFLVDIVSSDNIIYRGLRDLFRNMAEGDDVEGRLRCEAERLKHRLTAKFSWDFDDLQLEEGDNAPVIVEIDGS